MLSLCLDAININSVLDVLRVSLFAVSQLLTLERSSFRLLSMFETVLAARSGAYHQRTFVVENSVDNWANHLYKLRIGADLVLFPGEHRKMLADNRRVSH